MSWAVSEVNMVPISPPNTDQIPDKNPSTHRSFLLVSLGIVFGYDVAYCVGPKWIKKSIKISFKIELFLKTLESAIYNTSLNFHKH